MNKKKTELRLTDSPMVMFSVPSKTRAKKKTHKPNKIKNYTLKLKYNYVKLQKSSFPNIFLINKRTNGDQHLMNRPCLRLRMSLQNFYILLSQFAMIEKLYNPRRIYEQ